MRIFLALELDRNMREKALDIVKNLQGSGADVKWVEWENLHLTLKFLGEVNEDNVKVIVKEVTAVAKGVKPFEITLEGAGVFGSPTPRVVWIGVKEGKEKLLGMMGKMNESLDKIRKDSYPPAAHLTLGRIKSGRNRDLLLQKVQEMKDVKVGGMGVKEIRLKQSVLGREGPIYSDVKVFPLRD